MTKFSKIMLGTVQFGLNYGIANSQGKPSFETVKSIVLEAFQNGITSFDTAASYGESESVLGRVFEQLGIADRVQVVSKLGHIHDYQDQKNLKKFLREQIKQSLERLRLPKLSFLLLHTEEDVVYLPMLRDFLDPEQVGGIGVSLDSTQYLREAAQADYIQIPMNLLDHRFDVFVKTAAEHGATVFTRSVFLQGLLLLAEQRIPLPLRGILEHRNKLEQIGQAAGIPFNELCIRYLRSNPYITSILMGVDTREQLHRNLQIVKAEPLPSELVRELQQAVPILNEELVRPSAWHLQARAS